MSAAEGQRCRGCRSIKGEVVLDLGDQPAADHFPLASDPLLSTYREALRDAVARHTGVTLLDPTSWICPDGTCPALIDGVRVHIDDNHVSEAFVLAHERELAALLRQVGLGVRGAA